MIPSVTLYKNSLWFNQKEQHMEMIARKPTPIFPILSFEVHCLNSDDSYEIWLTIERKGSERMGYDKSSKKWAESKKRGTKGTHEYKKVKLAGGAKSGKELMEKGVEFGNVKISAREQDKDIENVIFVDTMHKYIPVVTIVSSSLKSTVLRAEIEDCTFIPVTVYQSPTIGQWKSGFNKYATIKNGGKGAGCSVEKEETLRNSQPTVQRIAEELQFIDVTINQENLYPWTPLDTAPPPIEQYWNHQCPMNVYASHPTPPEHHGVQGYQDWSGQYYPPMPMPYNYYPTYNTLSTSTSVHFPEPTYAHYQPTTWNPITYQGYGYH